MYRVKTQEGFLVSSNMIFPDGIFIRAKIVGDREGVRYDVTLGRYKDEEDCKKVLEDMFQTFQKGVLNIYAMPQKEEVI